MALDGYEQRRGVWVDSTGNQLTYLPWCGDGPSHPGPVAPYLSMWKNCDGSHFDDSWNIYKLLLCVKCSSQYRAPTGYSCLETDFGLVIIKIHHEKTVNATEARAICAADADYVHLPMPQNEVQNNWYVTYAKTHGLNSFWLGFKQVEGEWKTDNGDLVFYVNWESGSKPTSGDNYAHTTFDGSWGYSGSQKYFAICAYIVDDTSP